MQHSYDLVFQSQKVGEAVTLAPLIEALKLKGAELDAEGRGTWKLARGNAPVSPMVTEGLLLGLDVRAPIQDKTELLEELVKQMNEVTEALNGVPDAPRWRVMDPQRGDVATIGSLGSVLEEYLRIARYAGEYGGVSEALGLSTYVAPVSSGNESSGFRWLMLLVAFFVALYAGWRVKLAFEMSKEVPESSAPGPVKPAMPMPVPNKPVTPR